MPGTHIPCTHVVICQRYVNKTFCQWWHASTMRPCWDFLRRGNNYQPDRTSTAHTNHQILPQYSSRNILHSIFCRTLLKLKAMMLTTNLIICAMHVFVAHCTMQWLRLEKIKDCSWWWQLMNPVGCIWNCTTTILSNCNFIAISLQFIAFHCIATVSLYFTAL